MTRRIALIPAHDEEARVGRVVRGAGTTLPVLVVDDGSSDATSSRAEEAGAEVVVQRPNQGKGAALRTGFRHALAAGVDAVVTLDADGQHDASELTTFVAAHERLRDAQLIVGRRDFGQMPVARRAANLLGTVVLSAALGRWIPDNQSGYRLVGRRLMEATLDSTERGFEFEVEMIAICLREGWPVEWVPIRTIYGDERSHIRPLAHLRHFLRVVAKARRISREAPRGG